MPKRSELIKTTPGFIFSCDCEEHAITNREGTLSCSECHKPIDYQFPSGIRISNIPHLNISQLLHFAFKDTAFFSWRYLPHHINLENGIPKIHHDFYQRYDNRLNRRLGMISPRYSAKSTIMALVVPAKETAFQISKFGLMVSEEFKLAAMHLLTLRMEFMDNPIFRQDFGNLVPKRKVGEMYKWESGDFITTTDIRWMARGLRQRARGAKHRNMRYNLVIVEDPESKNNTITAESVKENSDRLSREIIPALDRKNGRIYFSGNVICSGCIAENIHNSKKWETVFEIAEPNGQGSSYWHLLWPPEALKDERDEYESRGDFETFEIEYNNNPNPKSVRKFDMKKLMYWQGAAFIKNKTKALRIIRTAHVGESGKVWKEHPEEMIPVEFITAADYAWSDKSVSDFTAIGTIGVDAIGRAFVERIDHFRTFQIDELAEKTFEHIVDFHPSKAALEENSVGLAVKQQVQKLMFEYNLKHPTDKLTTSINEIVVLQTEQKERRLLISIQRFLNFYMLYIKEEHRDLFRELQGFNKLVHDDTIDMLATALDNCTPCQYKDMTELRMKVTGGKGSRLFRNPLAKIRKNRWMAV